MKGLLGFVLMVVVAMLLRSTALSALASRGVLVDVLVFATVAWALREGESSGVTFGFVLGLIADIDAAHWAGRHALALAVLGYVVGRLCHSLVRESARTQIVLLMIATFAHQLWATSFELHGWASWPYLVQRVLFASFATAPIGALILWLIRRVGGRPLYTHASHDPGPTA